jgi:ariadne-1
MLDLTKPPKSIIFVLQNTKPCPGCNSPVVKDGGCNHMQCSRCHYDFCWLCLARLDTHLMAHVCNQYNPAEHADSDDEKRSLFFTERFQAHEEAEYFAKKQVEASDQLLEKLLERFYLDPEDIEGLSVAGKILLRARGFLKYSYVAAYGLRLDQKHRATFEKHQGVLELFTEQLSRLSEMPLEVVYMERGETGLVRHLRAIAFYSSSVERYIERVVSFAKGIQDAD